MLRVFCYLLRRSNLQSRVLAWPCRITSWRSNTIKARSPRDRPCPSGARQVGLPPLRVRPARLGCWRRRLLDSARRRRPRHASAAPKNPPRSSWRELSIEVVIYMRDCRSRSRRAACAWFLPATQSIQVHPIAFAHRIERRLAVLPVEFSIEARPSILVHKRIPMILFWLESRSMSLRSRRLFIR